MTPQQFYARREAARQAGVAPTEVTRVEAAHLLGCCDGTIRQLEKRGLITGRREGGSAHGGGVKLYRIEDLRSVTGYGVVTGDVDRVLDAALRSCVHPGTAGARWRDPRPPAPEPYDVR